MPHQIKVSKYLSCRVICIENKSRFYSVQLQNKAEHLNRPEEKCQAGPVGRAEHQPIPGKRCQAEQQNHPKVQLEAGDGWGGSVTRAEHQPRSEEQSQADRGRPVSQAEHLLRSEEQCQAEQQNQPHVQRETEDDCWGGSVNRAEQLLRSEADCQAEQQRRIGQAEHPWADKNTHTVRQPTTIPVAVARQVDVPIITIREQILTLNAQADMDRGEQRKEDQAEQSDSRTDRQTDGHKPSGEQKVECDLRWGQVLGVKMIPKLKN